MTYEVMVQFGVDGINIFKFDNVKEVFIHENYYALYAEDVDLLFSAPVDRIVYVRQL